MGRKRSMMRCNTQTEGVRMTQATPPDWPSFARDWLTIWQSELAASASDREWPEAWARLAAAFLGSAPPADARPADVPAGPDAPARPAPAAAASDAGLAALARLTERFDALERRLAVLE